MDIHMHFNVKVPPMAVTMERPGVNNVEGLVVKKAYVQ